MPKRALSACHASMPSVQNMSDIDNAPEASRVRTLASVNGPPSAGPGVQRRKGGRSWSFLSILGVDAAGARCAGRLPHRWGTPFFWSQSTAEQAFLLNGRRAAGERVAGTVRVAEVRNLSNPSGNSRTERSGSSVDPHLEGAHDHLQPGAQRKDPARGDRKRG